MKMWLIDCNAGLRISFLERYIDSEIPGNFGILEVFPMCFD